MDLNQWLFGKFVVHRHHSLDLRKYMRDQERFAYLLVQSQDNGSEKAPHLLTDQVQRDFVLLNEGGQEMTNRL